MALVATTTTGSQVLPLANGTNTGDLIVLDNISQPATAVGTCNSSTGVFTVEQEGMYFIQIVTRTLDNPTSPSKTVGGYVFVDIDNAGITGVNNPVLDYPPPNGSNLPAGVKGRGFAPVMVYLTAGQTFVVRGLGANSSTVPQALKTDGQLQADDCEADSPCVGRWVLRV